MKFINDGKAVQVRENEEKGYRWTLLKKGETIDLPESVGNAYGFKKVLNPQIRSIKGKIGKTLVETKIIEFDNKKSVSFWNDLLKIKGIGLKTAKDIIKVFKSEEELKFAISNDQELPFRDDIWEKLRGKYG